jgi:hypothetical protein
MTTIPINTGVVPFVLENDFPVKWVYFPAMGGFTINRR